MSQLPLEIWALIIDHPADDPAALQMCSLIETRLVPLARKYLFETLWFDALGLEESETRFDELEIRFPVIAPYVRKLVFVYHNDDSDRDAGPRKFAMYMDQFASALGSQLETLCLYRASLSERQAIIPTAGFPHLRHLLFVESYFESVDFIAACIATCPLLRSLTLNDCYFGIIEFREAYSLPPLHELELRSIVNYQDDILPWVFQTGLASTLRSLKIKYACESDLDAIASFIASSTPCLSALSITLRFRGQSLGIFE
jgi:hypothetical protein